MFCRKWSSSSSRLLQLVLQLLWYAAWIKSLECPPEEWTCRWSSRASWEAKTTDEDVVATYQKEVVSITCGRNGNGQTKLTSGFLRKFKFETLEMVRFVNCQQPNTSFAEILDGQHVSKLRLSTGQWLNDSLNADIFHGLSNLTYLNLMDNGLTSLPKTLLDKIPKLQTLNLRNNNLIELGEDLFVDAPQIENLELGYNEITALNQTVAGLQNLKTLNLHNNKLRWMSKEFFASVPSLTSLDLQGNLLETLSEDVFADLKHLQTLKLFTNSLRNLPERLLRPLQKLEDLNLSDNRELWPLPIDFLNNLPSSTLTKLNLGRCGLHSIPDAFFGNHTTLTTLHLDRNNITTLSASTFRGFRNLVILDLSRNMLSSVQGKLFGNNMPRLEKLLLQYNKIDNISQSAFTGMHRLRTLDLSHNYIGELSDNVFKFATSLRYLDIGYNNLKNTEAHRMPFDITNEWRYVNVTHNQLQLLPLGWFTYGEHLVDVDLSYNQITYFDTSDFQPVSDNVTIDLRYNNITYVATNLGFMKILNSLNPHRSALPVVRLGHNPIACNCHIDDFLAIIKTELDLYLVNIQDQIMIEIKDMSCESPQALRGHPVSSLNNEDLACDITAQCPETCICRKIGDRKAIREVDCSQRNLTVFPKILPANTTVAHMDGNQLTTISQLGEPRWEDLTHLYLNSSQIKFFKVTSFPSKMRLLNLSDNNIQRLSQETLLALEKFSNAIVWLDHNPWKCDCETAGRFKDWLNENTKRIGNLSSVTCNGTHTGVPVYKADICPPDFKEFLVFAIFASIFMAIGMATVGISVYRYRIQIKVWLYAHQMCLWYITESELDRDKKYDAFISFAQDDSEFVASHLLPGLESSTDQQQPSYKVCIHYRDWLAGEWIPDQIIRSVQNSRRTIVVLSKNFIRSVWGRLEFKAAHHQALQDRTNRIIMVVLGDLPPPSEMDSELKMYIKFNTYLNWNDPWFWQKLRYAMPHNPLSKLNLNWTSSPSNATSHNLKTKPQKRIDKIELVRA